MTSVTIRYPSDTTSVKEETLGGYTYLTLTTPFANQIQLIRAPAVEQLQLPAPVLSPPLQATPVVRTTSTSRTVSNIPSTSRILAPQPTIVNTPAGPAITSVPSYWVPSYSAPQIASYSVPSYSVPSYSVPSYQNRPAIVNTPTGPVLTSVPSYSVPSYSTPQITSAPNISSRTLVRTSGPRTTPVTSLEFSDITPTRSSCIGQENILLVKIKGNVNVEKLVKMIEEYVNVVCTEVRGGVGSRMLSIHLNDGDAVNIAYDVLVEHYGLSSKDVEFFK